MKKFVSMLLIVLLLTATVSCSSGRTPRSVYTFEEFMTAFREKVAVTQEAVKQADLLGADNGIGFVVGDKAFEIYEFSDKDKLNDARDGNLKFAIEGIGEFDMKTAINGKYVLMYNSIDHNVIRAFVTIL